MARSPLQTVLLSLLLVGFLLGALALASAAPTADKPGQRNCNCPKGQPHEAPGGGYMDERWLDRGEVVFMLKPHPTPGLLSLSVQLQGLGGVADQTLRFSAHLSGPTGNRTLNLRPLGRGVWGAPVALTAAPYLVQVQVNRGALVHVVGFRFIVVHVEGPVVVPGSLPDPRDKCCSY